MTLRALLVWGLALACWAVQGVSVAGPTPAPRWGKTLLASYDVDETTVRAYARHRPSKNDPHESALVNAMMADSVDWLGPEMTLEPGGNPYVVVVTMTATALADGDAVSLWRGGWRVSDSESRAGPLAGLNREGLKAGERFSVTAAASPLSFKMSGARRPEVSLLRADNLRIESVHVEVWQGLRPRSWIETLMSFKLLLIGLVMLPLGWWVRRSLRTGF